jgi:hypothetical protein
MHEANSKLNKNMMSQFMDNFPHRSLVKDHVGSNMTDGYERWNNEISADHIADYQRSLDMSGHSINPVEVEQSIYAQALSEAEIIKAEEIAAAGEAFKNALLQGMLKSTSKPKDEGRSKPVKKMENLRGEKPGFVMAEGTNWWSVDEKDPYWQTKEGHKEAMKLYGQKPSWVKESTLEYNPRTGKYDSIEKEEFVDLKPKKRISI